MGVLLFAQMAIAAYVCPGPYLSANTQMQTTELVKTRSDDLAISAVTNHVAPCESMGDDMATGSLDPQNANLCAEHCKFGQQSDQATTLSVPAALLMALYFVPQVPKFTAELRPAEATPSALVAAFPPHTILHCSFRI